MKRYEVGSPYQTRTYIRDGATHPAKLEREKRDLIEAITSEDDEPTVHKL